MDLIALIGRIVFAFMFVTSGANHLTKRSYMTEYAQSMGLPAARILVPVSGLLIIAAGLMVAVGVWGDLGAALLIVFLIPTSFYMRAFWKFDDAQMREQQQFQFMKNITMSGGAMITIAFFLCSETGLTVTDPLFG